MAAELARSRSWVGRDEVRAWGRALLPGASVLDVGCGTGVPVSEELIRLGLDVRALDPSPRMLAFYSARFPDVPTACEPAETSALFGRTFDGIVAWGVLFLLPPQLQRRVLRRLVGALAPGGRLLFTAPAQRCAWRDSLTGRRSVSLGAEAYRRLLSNAGCPVLHEREDAGGNHSYEARRDGHG